MNQKLDRFRKYLNRYQKLVKKNAANFVDERLAEDVAQETFIKMYEHMDFLVDDTVKQWLIVVSGNIAKDYLKKGGSITLNPMEPEKLDEYMERCCESAEECFERESRQKAARELLRTACNLLYERNPLWYYILVDSCMLGMSSSQIGEVFHMTAGNVDVTKTRARQYLRKVLGKDYQELF